MLAAQMVQFDGGSVEAKPKWGFPQSGVPLKRRCRSYIGVYRVSEVCGVFWGAVTE